MSSSNLLEKVRGILKPVHPNIEKIELIEGTVSYTGDKERLVICTKDRKGKYYSESVIAYVFLSCFAYTLTSGRGKTNEWSEIFRKLLKIALEQGIALREPGDNFDLTLKEIDYLPL